ncbi:MAG: DUF4115 domain-containing protein [candidate division NC10 bacterium]|nr:DUF4115 domain-containing protein [candidate division NC10 bacterium]
MPKVEGTGPTVGQRLRERREAKGLSLEEVMASTRIKLVFLKAMEEDDYRLLPDETYIIRFLMEYAAFLGLDPQAVAAQFKKQVQGRDGRGLSPWPAPKTYTLSLRKILLVLGVLLIVVPLGLIGFSLLSQRTEEVVEVRSPEIAEQPRVELASPPPILPEQGIPQQEGIPPPRPQAIPERPSEPVQHVLRVRAKERTWVRASADEKEYDVLLRPGDVVHWTALERFVLTLGNAGGVELLLDGSPIPVLGRSGQVIRDLVLLEEGRKRF